MRFNVKQLFRNRGRVAFFIRLAVMLIAFWSFQGFFPKSYNHLQRNQTLFVSQMAKGVVAMFYPDVTMRYGFANGANYYEIKTEGRGLVLIADECNGILTTLAFLAFVIAFPAPIISKFIFGFIGVIIVYIMNQLRILSLIIIHDNYYHLFPVFHKFIFSFVLYATIFGLWYYWIERNKKFFEA